MKLENIIQWERKTGSPIYQQDGLTIRPISRSLAIWWQPYGGAIRNWPVALKVEANGKTGEIPINNITLKAQIGLGLIVILANLFVWIAGKRQ